MYWRFILLCRDGLKSIIFDSDVSGSKVMAETSANVQVNSSHLEASDRAIALIPIPSFNK
jgi:hypothetical protein